MAADVSIIRKIVKKSTGIANELFDVESERVTFALPLRSLAEFDSLEEQVNNLQVKKQRMKELTTFGGSDLKRITSLYYEWDAGQTPGCTVKPPGQEKNYWHKPQ